jgi:hypothetical protein
VFPVLIFWRRLGICSGDYANVEVSEDYGCTWKILASFTNVWLATGSPVLLDVSEYTSSPITIRFRLCDDNYGYGYETWGWDIDDVYLGSAELKSCFSSRCAKNPWT